MQIWARRLCDIDYARRNITPRPALDDEYEEASAAASDEGRRPSSPCRKPHRCTPCRRLPGRSVSGSSAYFLAAQCSATERPPRRGQHRAHSSLAHMLPSNDASLVPRLRRVRGFEVYACRAISGARVTFHVATDRLITASWTRAPILFQREMPRFHTFEARQRPRGAALMGWH